MGGGVLTRGALVAHARERAVCQIALRLKPLTRRATSRRSRRARNAVARQVRSTNIHIAVRWTINTRRSSHIPTRLHILPSHTQNAVRLRVAPFNVHILARTTFDAAIRAATAR